MKITSYDGSPNSTRGKVVVEGLYIDEKGHTEPVVVIRASEPAAFGALMGYLDAAKIRGYDSQTFEQIMGYVKDVQAWQSKQAGVIFKPIDEHVTVPMPVEKKEKKNG